jgi:hypothetical protein
MKTTKNLLPVDLADLQNHLDTANTEHFFIVQTNAREWFDKVNGNSYFSFRLEIENLNTGKRALFTYPFEYGYDDQYQHAASKIIKTVFGFDQFEFSRQERKNIKFVWNKRENCKKTELENVPSKERWHVVVEYGDNVNTFEVQK